MERKESVFENKTRSVQRQNEKNKQHKKKKKVNSESVMETTQNNLGTRFQNFFQSVWYLATTMEGIPKHLQTVHLFQLIVISSLLLPLLFSILSNIFL